MGIFHKLFGRSNPHLRPGSVGKTAAMLDAPTYWDIVEKALAHSPDQDEQERSLIAQLKRLLPQQIVGFKLRTAELLYELYNSEMWCAAYIINGGCSDDSFEYFRCWVISRGKDAYHRAKTDPDTLVDELIQEEENYEFESYLSIPDEAFSASTDKDIYHAIDDSAFAINEASKKIDFTWDEEDPASMQGICPKLFAAKWITR